MRFYTKGDKSFLASIEVEIERLTDFTVSKFPQAAFHTVDNIYQYNVPVTFFHHTRNNRTTTKVLAIRMDLRFDTFNNFETAVSDIDFYSSQVKQSCYSTLMAITLKS